MNPSRRFYLARNNQKHGPYPFEQFKHLAANGLVLPTDMVLEEGQSKWLQASSVEGLWPLPAAPLVPTPRSRHTWNPVKIGIVSIAVMTMMVLIIIVAFRVIDNKGGKPTEPKDEQPVVAENKVHRIQVPENRPVTGQPTKNEPQSKTSERDIPRIEIDPVSDFKGRAKTFEMLVPERPFVWQGGDDRYRRFVYILTDVRFDVKRNDSLVYPFLGTLSYNEKTRCSVPYNSKIEAEKAVMIDELSQGYIQHVHTFLYRDGVWERQFRQSRSFDVFSKSGNPWADCGRAEKAVINNPGHWMEENLWAIENDAFLRQEPRDPGK